MIRANNPLPPLENGLLWAMRAWTIGSEGEVDAASRIRLLFSLLNAPEAAGYLDDFMWVLSHSVKRGLQINCTCNPSVSTDESRLLDVFGLLQEGYPDAALTLLEGMISGPAAGVGCDIVGRLVQALLNAGHRLPRGLDAVWRHCFQRQAGPQWASPRSFLH